MRIVFMGTPEFAVPSLDILIKNNYTIVAVITAPDKPAGRGLAIQKSAIKQYAETHHIKVLQPEKLKEESFINELKLLQADLQIVVAFRMLPEIIWAMPKLGTFNLHASLLPQYRGAAPINYAIINGEKESGATTFFLQHEIDTGNIIQQSKCTINEDENAGDLHDKLMYLGADLVLKTVQLIEKNEIVTKEQKINNIDELKTAPKIFKEQCKIDWDKDINTIHNLVRGLSPYPTAYTEIITKNGDKQLLKVYKTNKEIINHQHTIGTVISDNKTYLKVAAKDGFINLINIQLAGKKAMNITDFLRGYDINAIEKII